MSDDAKRGQKELEKKAKEVNEQAEEKKEEVKGKLSLVVDLAKQSYDFGLYLTCLSLWNATFELPFGLARAGAAATRTIVDAGDSKGAAKATAAMVKLGLLNLVRDIVVVLSQHDRSDVVSQITIGLLGEGEFRVVSQINNALITAGYTKEATAVGAVMGKQVTKGFFEGLKEAGANLLPSIWGDDSSTDDSAHAKKGDHAHNSNHGGKIDKIQDSSHSQESDHGLGDMGIDSDSSVLPKDGTHDLLGAT